MKIVMIGAGNLATNLGSALLEAGHDFIQVYSRTIESAQSLATKLGGAPTTDLNALNRDADVYIFAVKDSVLGELIPTVCKGREQKVFLHTAGSMPLDVFKGMALHYGVLYPMQTFSKSKQMDFKEVPVFIETNDVFAAEKIVRMAESITDRIYSLSSEDRKYLHLAAVFACNFANHCYSMAADILDRRNIPFDVLLPLIDETARKVHELPPDEAQTGPAVRFDENVIRSQSMMLKDNPLMKDLYERMSVSINRKAKKGKNKSEK